MNTFAGFNLDAAFCLRLTEALVYFAGQAAVIGLAAWALNWILQGASATLRYGVNVAALALMLVCLPVTFACLSPRGHAAQELASGASGDQIADAKAGSAAGAAQGGAGQTMRSPRVAPARQGEVADSWARAFAAAKGQSGSIDLTPLLRAAAPATAAAYLFGVALMLLRVSAALWGGHRLRCSSTPVKDAALLALIARQARRLGMRAAPAVAWCQRVSVPVVVGVARPLVLLPASLASGLSLDQLESLLTHELAHIRRYDLIVNLLQRLAEAMLFFHPAVWYVSRQVSAERENCCDDLVVATGCGRLEYADALVRMAELCTLRPGGVLPRAALLAASGETPSHFKRRVLHLLNVDANPQLRLTRGAVLATVLLPALILLTPALVPGGTKLPPTRADKSNTVKSVDHVPATASELAAGQLIAALSQEAETKQLQQSQATARGTARLALFVMDLVDREVTLVAKEPKPGFAYCGSASWSSDGGRVLFDATPGKDWSQTRVQTIETIDGGTQLTDLGLGNCPSLSPDGKHIAFLYNADSGSQRGLWMMRADGSGRRRLGGYGVPRWSPDGRQLLVSSFGTPCQVSLIDNSGLEQRVRLAGYEFRSVPYFAGDNDTLVATVYSPSGLEIALIDVSQPQQARIKQVLWKTGGELALDLQHPGWAGSCPAAAYDAASGRCVFVGWNNQGAALYLLQAGQSSPPQRLETRYDYQIASLALSPDGRYLLFCSNRHEASR